jgi:hypothetical protein
VKRCLPVVTVLIALALLTGCAAGGAAGGRDAGPVFAEVIGTWVGPAYNEMEPDPAEMTVVLDELEGVLVGYMMVAQVMEERMPLANLSYGDGTLRFDLLIEEGGMSLALNFEFKKEEDVLRGTFSSDMFGGTATLRRVP